MCCWSIRLVNMEMFFFVLPGHHIRRLSYWRFQKNSCQYSTLAVWNEQNGVRIVRSIRVDIYYRQRHRLLDTRNYDLYWMEKRSRLPVEMIGKKNLIYLIITRACACKYKFLIFICNTEIGHDPVKQYERNDRKWSLTEEKNSCYLRLRQFSVTVFDCSITLPSILH